MYKFFYFVFKELVRFFKLLSKMNIVSSGNFLKLTGSITVIVVTASLVRFYLRRKQNKIRKSYPKVRFHR